MRKIILSFFILLIAGSATAQIQMVYTSTPPVIGDGVIDDVWKIAPPVQNTIVMDAAEDNCKEGSDGKTQIETPSGQWRAMYDNDNIYVLVEVHDDNLNATPYNCDGIKNWEGDGIEIFLAQANNSYQSQIGLGYAPGKSSRTYGNVGFGTMDWYITDATVKINGTDYNGYFLEIKIPKSLIGIAADAMPNTVKMELGINQSNTGNGRSAQILTWTNANNLYNNASNYGTGSVVCDNAIEITDIPNCANGNFTLNSNMIYDPSTIVTNPASNPTPVYQWERSYNGGAWTTEGNTASLAQNDLALGEYRYRLVTDYRTSCVATVNVGSLQFLDKNLAYQCDNSNALQLTISNVTSGVAPYTYSYSKDGTFSTNVINSNTPLLILPADKIAGDYKVAVEDANGCSDTTFNKVISFPPALTEINNIDIECNVSTYTLNVKNIPAGYQYSCSETGNPNNWVTSPEFENLSPNRYDILIKDIDTECYSDVLQQELLSPPADFTFDYKCNDETSIILEQLTGATGGSGDYRYSLDNKNDFKTNLSDLTITPIASGNHSVTVKDAETGCTMEISNYFTKPQVSLNPSTNQDLKADAADFPLVAASLENFFRWKKDGVIIQEGNNAADNIYNFIVANNIGVNAVYSVQTKDGNGCFSDPASIRIAVEIEEFTTFITPYLPDGVNDVFAPDYAVTIFNRAGKVIYDNKAKTGWNGSLKGKPNKLADPGIYFYTVDIGNGQVRRGSIEVIKK